MSDKDLMWDMPDEGVSLAAVQYSCTDNTITLSCSFLFSRLISPRMSLYMSGVGKLFMIEGRMSL